MHLCRASAQGAFPHTGAAERAHLTVTGVAYEKLKIWRVLSEGLRPEKQPPPRCGSSEVSASLHTWVHTFQLDSAS